MSTTTTAAVPAAEPLVQHYTELLLLPFRLVKSNPPYTVEALSLQALAGCLDEAWTKGGAGAVWAPLPATAIPVAFPKEAEALPPGFDAAAWQQHQALAYFHPMVRSFLFGSKAIAEASQAPPKGGEAPGNDYQSCYRRSDLKRISVTLWNGEAQAEETRFFKVVRADLALFQPDVGVLQLELQAQVGDGVDAGWPLSTVQRVRDELRRLFPPYLSNWPQWHGGHCPLEVAWSHLAAGDSPEAWKNTVRLTGMEALAPLLSIAPDGERMGLPLDAEALPMFDHWRAWLGLEDVCQQQDWRLLPPGDDRLPSLAFMALDNPRQLSRGDWIRLAFADAPGSDALPYARNTLSDFEQRYCYDRFWHDVADSSDAPSRIMNCGYAFTMVGAFSDKGFFMNPRDGAWVSFRQIYARMGLVAHFHKAALLGALARLSALAWRDPDGAQSYDKPETHERLQRFYAEFLEFTQVYWFDEVSPQAQGVELFAMWQRELRTPGLYEEVRQELKDLVEYMNAQAAQRQANEAHRLAEAAIKQTQVAEDFTRVAVVLGVVGVMAGILGMNWLPIDDEPWSLGASFSWVNLLWIGGTLVVTVLLAVLTWAKRPVWLARRFSQGLAALKRPDS